VFSSELIFDQTRFMDGIALKVRFHPSVPDRDDDLEKLRDMTKVYFENGGMDIQNNTVPTGTMRAAQESQETCRDPVVRISGYSANFVEQSKDRQNDVITRNENRL
jgi:formate C-acetyltransferase